MNGGGHVRVRRVIAVLLGLLLALCGAAHAQAASPSPSSSPPPSSAAPHAAQAAQVPTVDTRSAYDTASADDPGPSRCHKSKGDDGALPAAPSTTQQQTQVLALPVCLTPESHSAIGAAHARLPVRGPAPAPPPTPIELSVLRV
jgi:hypothetical protein